MLHKLSNWLFGYQSASDRSKLTHVDVVNRLDRIIKQEHEHGGLKAPIPKHPADPERRSLKGTLMKDPATGVRRFVSEEG
jgi:hypothetical protein